MNQTGPAKQDDAAKKAAAEAAVALIEDGMLLGLGTGSTAWYAVEAIAARIRAEGLRLRGVPTSEETRRHAEQLGIPLTSLDDITHLDLALDGADEVERGTLGLIKGLGGALLREKMVAQASRRFVIMADASKLVGRLGERVPLPVEVTPFAHVATARRLPGRPVLRRRPDGTEFVTDNANVIYDCHEAFADGTAPAAIAATLAGIAGVVGQGLFLDCTEAAMIGAADGTVQVLRPGPS